MYALTDMCSIINDSFCELSDASCAVNVYLCVLSESQNDKQFLTLTEQHSWGSSPLREFCVK